MKLIFTVKPSVVKGRSKEDIKSKCGLHGWTISNNGTYYTGIRDDDHYVRVVNFQKFRKKTRQTKKVVKGKSVTTSTVIRASHWVGYVYRIPVTFLKESDMKVVQKKRNFVLQKKK